MLFTTAASGATLSFTPTQPGKYAVTATGHDALGATATDTLRLSVVKLAPTVTIKGPAVGVQGHALVFNGAVNGVVPKDGSGDQFQWALLDADGNSVTLPSQPELAVPPSGFLVPGTLPVAAYEVVLRATVDSVACQQTFAFDVIPTLNNDRVDMGMLPTLGMPALMLMAAPLAGDPEAGPE